MKNRNGVGIIEVIGGVVLTGLFVFTAMKVVPTMFKSGEKSRGLNDGRSDLARAINHILKIGRLSTSCLKASPTSPAGVALECDVDFNFPATGALTDVRFVLFNGDSLLHYQTKKAGTWEETITYGDKSYPITAFTLCATAEMTAVNPTCPLLPTELSSNFGKLFTEMATAVIPIDYTNRYFRFALVVQTAIGKMPLTLQSAFFLRNPTGIAGLAYQWGSGNE